MERSLAQLVPCDAQGLHETRDFRAEAGKIRRNFPVPCALGLEHVGANTKDWRNLVFFYGAADDGRPFDAGKSGQPADAVLFAGGAGFRQFALHHA